MDDDGTGVDLRMGALVGDGERADVGDLVAEELDAHTVVGGGREDVEDAAAHRELTTAPDKVDALVGHLHQRGQQTVEVDLIALVQGDRVQIPQARGHRLDHRADCRNDDAQRVISRGGESVQDGQALADGVSAG